MNAIKGVVRNGRIEVAAPADWPDGQEVEIVPTPVTVGMREEDWPTTPEGIAALIRRWERIEPLEMTPEEEVAMEEARRRDKEWHKAHFEEWGDELRKVWE